MDTRLFCNFFVIILLFAGRPFLVRIITSTATPSLTQSQKNNAPDVGEQSADTISIQRERERERDFLARFFSIHAPPRKGMQRERFLDLTFVDLTMVTKTVEESSSCFLPEL